LARHEVIVVRCGCGRSVESGLLAAAAMRQAARAAPISLCTLGERRSANA